MRNSVTSKVLKPVRRLFDGATSYAARCKPSPEALAQFQAYQRFRRSAQHVLSQIQCAALPAGQARRAQRAVFAASGILASSVAAVKGSLSHRRATIEEAAEDCTKLLSSVVKTPFKTYWRERLFTVECQPPYSDAPVLVITHGYAAGSGMFCFDLDRLAQHYHVFALDWLGCGASERPAWSAKTVAEGERFFTESLEAWATATGLGRFVLVGHSLGGYLSAAYTLHHPSRVSHLVLASPAGIPTPPDPQALAARQSGWVMGLLRNLWERGVTPQQIVRSLGPLGEKWAGNMLTARFRHVLEREGVDVEAEMKKAKEGKNTKVTSAASDGASVDAATLREVEETAAALDRYMQAEGEAVSAASGHNSSSSGTNSGTASTSSSSNNANGNVKKPGFDVEAFRRYLYDITVADASGELALHVLLSFGAHAREPMGPRLLAAARAGESPEATDPAATPAGSSSNNSGSSSAAVVDARRTKPVRLSAPITFIYGSHDWMDAGAGAATAQQLRQLGVDASCLITPASGHHLYMEQPDIFCAQILGRLRETDGGWWSRNRSSDAHLR